jgi:DMSO/TMAO reductase YedYZ molybdopterin-dependent catalytic subunit
MLVPHLYFWKSAKRVNGLRLMAEDDPGFGRRPATTSTETHGSSSGIREFELAGGDPRASAAGDPVGEAQDLSPMQLRAVARRCAAEPVIVPAGPGSVPSW